MHGDLRLSTKYRSRSVNEILADSLPVSGLLGGIAFCIATLGGVFIGSLAAAKQQTWIDRTAMFAALFAVSLPPFVIGPLLVLVFAIDWPVLPVGGWGNLQSLILPSITLAAPYTAYIARLTRSSMLEVLTQDYIRTARAKGLRESRVILRHVLPNALVPVVTLGGLAYANLLTGAVLTETVFSWPGLGRYTFLSASALNFPAIMAVTLLVAITYLVINLITDISYAFLDPRVRQ